jgi:hypothetical protein
MSDSTKRSRAQNVKGDWCGLDRDGKSCIALECVYLESYAMVELDLGAHTIFNASPIMNTMSESTIISGFLIRYPAITRRITACACMRVLDETRTILCACAVYTNS